MRIRSFWIFASVSVIASAIIAYALVFWTPLFGVRKDFGWVQYGWYVDSVTDSYDVYDYTKVQELAKLQPQQFQALVEALFNELTELTEAQLYILSAAGDDACLSTLINCQGVPSKNVKPFIEKALAHKQTRDTVTIATGSLETSRHSLVVSIFSFIVGAAGWVVAFLTFRRGKDNTARQPVASHTSTER